MSDFEQSKKTNSKSLKILAILFLGVIVLIGLIVYVSRDQLEKNNTKNASDSQSGEAAQEAQVSITADGFVPATLIMNKNTKVTFTNNDSKPRQLQANPHPNGTSLPDFKSKVLSSSQTYTYTFSKSGSFGYHDHLDPKVNGTIEVK